MSVYRYLLEHDSITIPAAAPSGSAAPYPSNIAVAGLAGAVTKVTVNLTI